MGVGAGLLADGDYDLASREAFFLAKPFADATEAPEVIAAVFATDRFGADAKHETGDESGAVKFPGPAAEVHAMAGGTFGVKSVG